MEQKFIISSRDLLKVNDEVALHNEIGNFVYLTKDLESKIRGDYNKKIKILKL